MGRRGLQGLVSKLHPKNGPQKDFSCGSDSFVFLLNMWFISYVIDRQNQECSNNSMKERYKLNLKETEMQIVQTIQRAFVLIDILVLADLSVGSKQPFEINFCLLIMCQIFWLNKGTPLNLSSPHHKAVCKIFPSVSIHLFLLCFTFACFFISHFYLVLHLLDCFEFRFFFFQIISE